MATTVQELINYLNDFEDKDQAVIYQYYLAEHFTTTPEIFEKVADDFDSLLPNDYDAVAEAIADYTSDEDED